MATSITPKSEFRKVSSISHGYGEVPMIEVEGQKGWGLPGKQITFCMEEAKAMAAELDAAIRQAMSINTRPLL